MADERLSDAEVQSLTCIWRKVGEFQVRPDLRQVEALATEVLASRGRRCGNCLLFEPESAGHAVACRFRHRTSGPKWSCADFTPKEAK